VCRPPIRFVKPQGFKLLKLGPKVYLKCMTVGKVSKTAAEFNQWLRRTDQQRDIHDSIDQPRYRRLKCTTERITANDRPILAENLVGRPLDCYSLWSHAKLRVLPARLQETKRLLYDCEYPRGIYDDGESIGGQLPQTLQLGRAGIQNSSGYHLATKLTRPLFRHAS
jgi:hypothetical protein